MPSYRRLWLAGALLTLVSLSASSATVTGTIRAAGGGVLGSMVAQAYDSSGTLRAEAQSDPTGLYVLQLAPGQYRVLAFDPLGVYATAFDGGADSYETSPLLTLTAAGAQVNFALVPAGWIGGVVLSNAGVARAGITVAAYNLSGTRRGFTTSREDGSYALALPPGGYKLVAFDDTGTWATQFYAQVRSYAEAAEVTVREADTRSGVDFSLERAARLSGTATDALTQTPLASIVVFAYSTSGTLVTSTTTDAVGAFRLSLPGGSYRLVAADPGQEYAVSFYAESRSFEHATSLTLQPAEARTGIAFAMVKGASVSGTVTSSTGTPLQDITVAAYNPDGTLHTSALSDAAGRYTLTVAPGDFKLVASDAALVYAPQFYPGSRGFAAAATLTAVADGATTSLDFTLEAGGRIIGTVRNAANAQILPRMTVAAYDAAGVRTASAETGTDGRYTLVVPPDSYRVLVFDATLTFASAYAGGAASFEETMPVTITAGAVSTVDLSMRRGVKVSGTVSNGQGEPLDGIEVFAVDPATGNRIAGATTAGGAFTLVVVPGSYKFVADDPSNRYGVRYYDSAATLAEARLLAVADGNIPPPLQFVLESSSRRRAVRHGR